MVERVRGEGRGQVDFSGRLPPAVYGQSFRAESVPRWSKAAWSVASRGGAEVEGVAIFWENRDSGALFASARPKPVALRLGAGVPRPSEEGNEIRGFADEP